MHKYRAEAYLRRFSLTVLSEQALLDDGFLESALFALSPGFSIAEWSAKKVDEFLKVHCPLPFVERVNPLV